MATRMPERRTKRNHRLCARENRRQQDVVRLRPARAPASEKRERRGARAVSPVCACGRNPFETRPRTPSPPRRARSGTCSTTCAATTFCTCACATRPRARVRRSAACLSPFWRRSAADSRAGRAFRGSVSSACPSRLARRSARGSRARSCLQVGMFGEQSQTAIAFAMNHERVRGDLERTV